MKKYTITWVEEHTCEITAKDDTEAEYLFHNATVFDRALAADTFENLLSVEIAETKELESENV